MFWEPPPWIARKLEHKGMLWLPPVEPVVTAHLHPRLSSFSYRIPKRAKQSNPFASISQAPWSQPPLPAPAEAPPAQPMQPAFFKARRKKRMVWCAVLSRWCWWIFLVPRVNRFFVSWVPDANLTGWGGVYEGSIVRGIWSPILHHSHINYLELFFLTLKHFLLFLKGHQVLVRMDNTMTMAYINRQGGLRWLCVLA